MGNDLVKSNSAAVALAAQYGVTGLEHVDVSELSPPFLGIAQGLSPELNPAEGKYIPDLKLGQYFIQGKSLGSSLNAVLCATYTEFVEWSPARQFVGKYTTTDETVLKARRDGLKAWNAETGNEIVKTTYLVLLAQLGGEWEPVVFAAKATHLSPVNKLLQELLTRRTEDGTPLPAFATALKLTTASRTNTKGTFFVPGHEVLPDEVPEEVMEKAAQVAKMALESFTKGRGANPAESQYSSAYENNAVVSDNVLDAVAESMK